MGEVPIHNPITLIQNRTKSRATNYRDKKLALRKRMASELWPETSWPPASNSEVILLDPPSMRGDPALVLGVMYRLGSGLPFRSTFKMPEAEVLIEVKHTTEAGRVSVMPLSILDVAPPHADMMKVAARLNWKIRPRNRFTDG